MSFDIGWTYVIIIITIFYIKLNMDDLGAIQQDMDNEEDKFTDFLLLFMWAEIATAIFLPKIKIFGFEI